MGILQLLRQYNQTNVPRDSLRSVIVTKKTYFKTGFLLWLWGSGVSYVHFEKRILRLSDFQSGLDGTIRLRPSIQCQPFDGI